MTNGRLGSWVGRECPFEECGPIPCDELCKVGSQSLVSYLTTGLVVDDEEELGE
jgi:hypothetical protein